MFVLAHLTDPHLPTPRGVPLVLFANKRALGYLSWRLRRVRIHRPDVLAALERDLAAVQPDHIVVSGDLINVSLPIEFLRASAWLATLGAPADVTVVPGNHDAYVAVPFEQSLAFWAPHLAGDSEPAGTFPFVRRRRDVALIGLSTALPTGPGMAWGRLGQTQCTRLADTLARLGGEGLFRIVVLHHPPLAADVPAHKRLGDAQALADVIAAHGAELILHGHNHRTEIGSLRGPEGPVPVIGAPSASAQPRPAHEGAGYHLYRIERADTGWRLDARARTYDPATGRLKEAALRLDALSLPSAVAPAARAGTEVAPL